MDIMNIVFPMLSIGGLGVVFGAGLGYAGEIFKVEEDPRVTAILEALPGANCGGCGFPGCGGLANAIVAGNAPTNACPVGGAACTEAISGIMGVEASSADPVAAYVKCGGTCEQANDKYDYFGIDDCMMAMQLAGGGAKTCSYGCLGLGSCEKACGFGAIEIIDGIAVIDKDKCVACGKCVSACPKHIIEMLPAKNKIKVQCSSKDLGKVVMQACKVGCISCKICEKTCKFDAIHIIDGIAVIDYTKCKGCTMCANKCPKNVITGKRVAPPAPAKPAATTEPKPAPAAPEAAKPATAEAPKPAAADKEVAPVVEKKEEVKTEEKAPEVTLNKEETKTEEAPKE